MNETCIKKIGVMLLVIVQVTFMIVPGASAITVDGDVYETTWDLWFFDSLNPSYSVYYSEDASFVYLGIVTSNSELDNNDVQVAFKALEYDWAIKLSDVSGYKYLKSNNQLSGYYWESSKLGLPDGVQLVRGLTDGKISYEISIEKDLLGKNGEDFPTKFKMWLMYAINNNGKWVWSVTDVPNGDVNFYPDSRSDWWFTYKVDDKVPVFHAPEIPFGTLLSVLLMFSAFLVVSKRYSYKAP